MARPFERENEAARRQNIFDENMEEIRKEGGSSA